MNTMEYDDATENSEEPDMEVKQISAKDMVADTLRILEALLFASDELLTTARIKSILPDNPDARQIRKMVDKINAQLQKERHPFEIVEIGGGYQFRTVAYYHPWVRQIFKEKAAKKLSIQALECLAVIAYKQPVSKAEIEAVRGVVSDGAMKTLLEKKLVTISGRSDKPGKPLQYSTTHEFLRYFGLNKIEDLPRIEEFEAIAREKIEDLSLEELTGGVNGEEEQQPDESDGRQGETGLPEDKKDIVETPEPTAVFEINMPEDPDPSLSGQAEPEEEEQTPEPTAVFEINVPEYPGLPLSGQAETEEEMLADQSEQALEPTALFEININDDQDMDESETTEIPVEQKDENDGDESPGSEPLKEKTEPEQ